MFSTAQRASLAMIVFLAATRLCVAEAVRNGNELALKFTRSTADVKEQLRKERTGIIHTFRFLKISGIARDTPAPGVIRLDTIEPSSDMKVGLVVTSGMSLELAGNVATGECVAAKGRIKSLSVGDSGLILIEPAVLLYKDKAAPKAGQEMLYETDPRALH